MRVIAIDGPAGSGKSTTARAVAKELGFAHLDSGALYRAVTFALLDDGKPLSEHEAMGVIRDKPIQLSWSSEVGFRPMLGATDVSHQIRTPVVSQSVSTVAAWAKVRDWANEEFHRNAAVHPRGVVADGRDIGTVVFPRAGLKIFLTADPFVRARRRAMEMANDSNLEDVADELTARDRADQNRNVAPLVAAPDAVHIDTSVMKFDEQVQRIVELARSQFDI